MSRPHTRERFAVDFLKGIGAPASDRNLLAVLAWMQAEHSIMDPAPAADFNPLNTTLRKPGSRDLPGNPAHVQEYASYKDGVEANVETMLSGAKRAGDPYGYKRILDALRRNFRPRRTLRRVESSAWGTGGLAKLVLKDVKRDYRRYAEYPVAS